jgi:hypothetical protein
MKLNKQKKSAISISSDFKDIQKKIDQKVSEWK